MIRGLLILALAAVCARTRAEPYKAPRNGWGHPDITGLWANSTATPLQWLAQFKGLTVSGLDGARLEERTQASAPAPVAAR